MKYGQRFPFGPQERCAKVFQCPKLEYRENRKTSVSKGLVVFPMLVAQHYRLQKKLTSIFLPLQTKSKRTSKTNYNVHILIILNEVVTHDTFRILIEGGCTPVGCVLIQILKNWKAIVTATCLKRAVPVVKALGASDIIILSEPTNPNNNSLLESEDQRLVENALLKELDLRNNVYDVIIKTSYECNLAVKDLEKFCAFDGTVISTLPPVLSSDSYGFFKRMLLTMYISLKCRLQVSEFVSPKIL